MGGLSTMKQRQYLPITTSKSLEARIQRLKRQEKLAKQLETFYITHSSLRMVYLWVVGTALYAHLGASLVMLFLYVNQIYPSVLPQHVVLPLLLFSLEVLILTAASLAVGIYFAIQTEICSMWRSMFANLQSLLVAVALCLSTSILYSKALHVSTARFHVVVIPIEMLLLLAVFKTIIIRTGQSLRAGIAAAVLFVSIFMISMKADSSLSWHWIVVFWPLILLSSALQLETLARVATLYKTFNVGSRGISIITFAYYVSLLLGLGLFVFCLLHLESLLRGGQYLTIGSGGGDSWELTPFFAAAFSCAAALAPAGSYNLGAWMEALAFSYLHI
ncbi:unnamed protein product [Vitrella brassicaformis CCMP3155]|uniref:Uncharacterized protein n=2 Tax=Vitrella brassicaformis TaxID=1169539 RepID=A0A0G4EFT6_VITBC|nr:unnamed protein product [Vitrella brassicaformis CCMP3155]|mmetsp:Transcript_38861/g.97195  ORF Transcript_38861/g.97195 Transcript_38861/m.97195 type:complete len:332 (+) Transcript_38861:149-1144(+)|eukprot:CEL95406.1 unnamed protein product [Vitrella brassicaformis CCMP3155]